MINRIMPLIDYPSAFSNWLDAFLDVSGKGNEFAICGKNAIELSRKFNSRYFPDTILAGSTQVSQLPFLANRFVDAGNLFYVCRNKTCHLPHVDFEVACKDLLL